MLYRPLRWLGRNLGTLLLAFVLAVVVWVSAVITNDPNEQHIYPLGIPIEVVGQDASLLQINKTIAQVQLTIEAPRSIWTQLNNRPETLRAWIDLSGLGPGEYTLQVKTQVKLTPSRVLLVDPAEVTVILEPIATRAFPVELHVSGEPALGYTRGTASISPEGVSVSGPASLVSQVVKMVATMDIAGSSGTVERSIDLQPVDASGNQVNGLTITPRSVAVTMPINLLGGYRNMVVKVVTDGQVANGFRLTSISVLPPTVTIFSGDPQQVNKLPGYVETQPISLNDLRANGEMRAELNLPSGVSLVGEQSVLVEIGVEAMEGSLTISLPLEVRGLPPELEASVSPPNVDVLLSGPLPILLNLSTASLRVVVNMNGMGEGVYQVVPEVDLLPGEVQVESILPESVSVTIVLAPTPTPTPLVSATPSPTSTLSPTPTSTPRPTHTPTPGKSPQP